MSNPSTLEGILPIDKPIGPTSHDLVNTARRALGMRRIGHTGTLDPFASGLMLLCLGRATRVAEFLSGTDKQYSATIRFGVATDTDDHTGHVISEADAGSIRVADVERALDALQGEIMQTPPAYSAKKKGGERAYDLARQGRAVELAPVAVTVRELVLMRWEPPFAHVDVVCSAGTYIRALARDAGAALGVGAHLSALRRTAVGAVMLEGALRPEELNEPERVRAAIIPPLDALRNLPRVDLNEEGVAHMRHGRPIPTHVTAAETVLVSAQGELVAVARVSDGMLRPRKVFL